MSKTTWDVWVVLANDPSQTVAYLPRWRSIQFSDQLNDVGSATIEHDFSDPFFAAFQDDRGDSLLDGPYALQIRRDGVAVFTFFIEDVQVDRAGVRQPLIIGGRGIATALEWGIVLPEDFSNQSRVTAGTTQRPKFFDRLFPGYAYNARVATTENLSATYTNGPQPDVVGAGARLTATSNGNINNAGIDGLTDLVVGDVVLVKNQSNPAHNGVYWIATIGGSSEPWILQRTARADGTPISDLEVGNAAFINDGFVNGYTSWAIVSNGGLDNSNQVGSVDIEWEQVSLGAFTGISAFYILFKEADTGFEYSTKKTDFGAIKTIYGRGGIGYAVDWPLSLDSTLEASLGKTDSKGRVVQDGGNFNIAVGRTLLDVLNEVSSNTGVDWHVSPTGEISVAVRPFVTDTIVFNEPFGQDLSSGSAALLFSLPMLESIETRTSVSELRTVVYGSDGFNLDRQISDRTGIYGFREMFIENTSDDAPAVANITSSAVRQVRDGKLQITTSFDEREGMTAWIDFDIGDKVLVEIDTGVFSERIISAVGASIDENGVETIEVTFGDVFQDLASNLKYAANYGRLGAADIPTFTLRGTSSKPSAPVGTSVGAEVNGLSNRVVATWEPPDNSSTSQYEAIIYREEQDASGSRVPYSIANIYRDGNSAYFELSSTDGITWTTRTSNFGNTSVNSVAFGNNLWVAGGVTGQIRTSTDAVTWTTRTSNFGTTIIRSLAHGNNLWVAGGDAGQIRTSTDAITWVTRTSNFGTTIIRSIAYGSGLWAAVGYSGQIRTSTDAITWVTQTSNVSVNIWAVLHNGINWVATGNSGTIITSTDATTWTTRTSNFTSEQVFALGYGNALWFAGGTGGQIRASTDSVTWVTRTSNFGTTTIRSIAYGNSLWVAGGLSGQIRASTDGVNWTTHTSNFGNTSILSVAYGNSLWVAGGASGQLRTLQQKYSVGDLVSISNTTNGDFDRSSVFLTSAGTNLFSFYDVGPDIPSGEYVSGEVVRIVERHSTYVPSNETSAVFENLAAPGREYQFTVVPYTINGQSGVPSPPFTFEASASPQVLFSGAIRSNNYVKDVSGWTVEASGDAEFNTITVRNGTWVQGTLTAPTIQTSTSNPRIILDSSGVYAFNSAGDVVTSIVSTTGAFTTTSGAFTGTIDVGGNDATSFHVDTNGNMWMGAATYATAPFRVSSSGQLDIGGSDSTSLHVDPTGQLWIGAADSANAKFRVSAEGVVFAGAGGIVIDTNNLSSGGTYTGFLRLGPGLTGDPQLGNPGLRLRFTAGNESNYLSAYFDMNGSSGGFIRADATGTNPGIKVQVGGASTEIFKNGMSRNGGEKINFTKAGNPPEIRGFVDDVEYYIFSYVLSDRRVKENIVEDVSSLLDKLFDSVKVYTFNYKEELDPNKLSRVGVIADEIIDFFPQAVRGPADLSEPNPDALYHVDYTYFVPILISVVQQLNDRVKELEARLV